MFMSFFAFFWYFFFHFFKYLLKYMAESDIFCDKNMFFIVYSRKNNNLIQIQKIQSEKQITGFFIIFGRHLGRHLGLQKTYHHAACPPKNFWHFKHLPKKWYINQLSLFFAHWRCPGTVLLHDLYSWDSILDQDQGHYF